MNILVSCLCITWNSLICLTCSISKWAGYKLPGIKLFFLWPQLVMWQLWVYCSQRPKPTTGHKLNPVLSELNTLQSPVPFEVWVFLGNLAIILAVGINRSSHILSKVATLQCKIFHVSSLSVSALQSKKVGQMTSHWYVTYFQTVQLSIPWLNFLGLLNTPHINYIKLQELLEN